MKEKLQEAFGNIDIYLFDQLLKGTFDNCKNIIDVGCGYGRNLVYFFQNNYQVFAIDENPEAIEEVKKLSKKLAPANDLDNFRVALAEQNPFQKNFFDIAVCSAVFHFAKNKGHFDVMLQSTWDVLKPGGFLFARLASDIGIEKLLIDAGDGTRYLPDGSQRFLVNLPLLLQYTNELRGELFEPIKTTNVQNLRCMTTWCLKKIG
jgi:SAM-dependent methyltransferase